MDNTNAYIEEATSVLPLSPPKGARPIVENVEFEGKGKLLALFLPQFAGYGHGYGFLHRPNAEWGTDLAKIPYPQP